MVAFILELAFLLGIAIVIILNRNDLLEKYMKSQQERYGLNTRKLNNYVLDDNQYKYKTVKGELGAKIINRIVAFILAGFFIYFAIPYVRDIPQLVTWNLEYTNGRAYTIKT